MTNPSDLIGKEENIKVFVRLKPAKDEYANETPYINKINEKHLDV